MCRAGECGERVGKVQRYRMQCTNAICDIRRVGGQRLKGTEWWKEKVGGAVAEKRSFEEWLHKKSRVTYDRYRAQRVRVNG